ncbi:hypothetical protein F5Y04DRAFT_51842 [Hypomontagnella monticulosa]|nr:hypothetical protein F5Y04DRAFT_51842 [Hypomontagnella monticulosa]
MDVFGITKLALPSAESLVSRASEFIGSESFLSSIEGSISSTWNSFMAYLHLPHVYWAIAVFAIVFTIVVTLGMCMGFGPAGIVPGSFAAAFQSFAYGAFTPAGGIFATLTSLAMLGLLNPAIAITSALIALIPASLVFVSIQD